MRRAAMTGLVGVVSGALIATSLAFSRRPAPQVPPRSDLAPDPERVRYRHSLAIPDTADDMASTMAALEARLKEAPNPFDAAELAELYYRRAQREGARADYATSETFAKRSLELLKEPNAARLTLAKLANARHEFRQAIEIAREYSTSKRSAGPYIVMATAHLALGEPAAAAEAAHTALMLRPDASGYLTRALALQAQGRDAEAAFDFSHAAALETFGDKAGAARLRTLWGRFLLRRGEHFAASTLFDEALRIVPGFALALAGRGELALRTGRPSEAAKLFEEAFAASRQVRYLIDQARALELSGDRPGANDVRAQAETWVRAELREDGLGHRLELVEILVGLGQREQLLEAVALAREELSRRSTYEVRFQLARALALIGNREEALIHVQAALALGTREAELYELAARVEPQPERAAMYAREADKLDPARTGWRRLGIGSP